MNVDDFAQVPDLDSQLLLNSSPVRHSDARGVYKQQHEMLPHLFSYNQAPYVAQEGECPAFYVHSRDACMVSVCFLRARTPCALANVSVLTILLRPVEILLETADPSSLRGLPQHFMQGVSDLSGGSFPLAGAAHPVSMFAPVVHHLVPSAGPQNDKPTAAQAAAGRLQRASARQAAKAAQQQKRQAQARAAAAAKGGGISAKRKKDEEDAGDEDDEEGTKAGPSRPILFFSSFPARVLGSCFCPSRAFVLLVSQLTRPSSHFPIDSDDDDDDEEEEEDSDGDATVPSGEKQPKPHEIAKTKYNHIEDEKERKRLKRLLRNRVSAQQARERKKAYMSTLEDERRNIQTKMAEMEARINTLERENFMLRQVEKNATQRKSGGAGHEKVGLALGSDESRAVPSH
jgi:hypothetical protein